MFRLSVPRLLIAAALTAGLIAPACGGLDSRSVFDIDAAAGRNAGGKATAGAKTSGGQPAASGNAGSSAGEVSAVDGGARSGEGGAGPNAGGGAPGSDGAPLGASCAVADECASEHCSDGVCCDAACTGVCATCNAAGKCGAPSDDSECPVVTCNVGGNECINYESEIATARCKSVGLCKAAEDCASPGKPAGTACNIASSNFSLCNGTGTCTVPVVRCGAADCAIGGKVCCFRRSGATTSQTCDAVANCAETFPAAEPARTPTECDEHADCRTGYLCSYVSASGGSHISCRLAGEANVNNTYSDWYEVCQSPAKTNACSGGRVCALTTTAFPGWKFCEHLPTD